MTFSPEPLCQFSDRLFFTTFPHPLPTSQDLNRSAAANGSPRIRGRAKAGPSTTPEDTATYYYFTIDDQLPYMSFFQDWGPLNLAMVYKACIYFHELLEDQELASHRLVLYSSNEPRRKANAALLMALYVMIVQRRAPWEAFHPIAELEFMPFRDAGRGPSDFHLSIQDCLWGIWKAMQNGLCDMNEFSVEEYEFYEKVENGDWNWITPNFIAFASPVDPVWVKKERERKEKEKLAGGPSSPLKSAPGPSTHELALQRKLPMPFQNCLEYFEKSNIKLVVRLNTELYDRGVFEERGIRHVEMYFDDGTNPTDEIVRRFIDLSDEIIEAGGVVAVHCKAGLGRTGTLIGAYLIWKYGFTAHEAIGFMRIVRPGSVVGPQQQYMYLKQLEWAKWAAVDEMQRMQAAAATASIPIVAPATPPAETEELDDLPMDVAAPAVIHIPPTSMALPPVTPSKHIAAGTAKARAITPPGQPRKTPVAKRVAVDSSDDENEENDVLPALGLAPSVRSPAKRTSTRTVANRQTASEQRPTRVTRSSTTSGGTRKPTAVGGVSTRTNGQAPNKIPRLANGAVTRSRAAATGGTTTMTTNNGRRPAQPPSPTPSRLPTLIPSKRNHASTLSDVAAATVKLAGAAADAWMKDNVSNVVVPATKSERPGLRSVRRRRSSFSSADVVA